MRLISANMNNIRPNQLQPREGFDREKLLELAESIRRVGLLQPIVVREFAAGYQIVAGERRWKACEIAGMKEIPVLVKDVDDERLLVESLIENLHREDLKSTERENAIYSLWQTERYESPRALAEMLGYSNGNVAAIIHAKEVRESLKIPKEVSTKTIRETVGLDDKTRTQLIEKVAEGKIPTTKVREVSKVLKKGSKVIKGAILSEKITPELGKELLRLPDEKAQKFIIEKAEKGHSEDELKDEIFKLRGMVKEKKPTVSKEELAGELLETFEEWLDRGKQIEMKRFHDLSKDQRLLLAKKLRSFRDNVLNLWIGELEKW